MGKVIELRALDHDFIDFITQHICEIEERLESLDQWVIYMLKLHDRKDQLLESLQKSCQQRKMHC